MEGIMKTLHPFLLCLFHLAHSSPRWPTHDCPTLPIKGLTCYNDYSHVVTCLWNSTFASDAECRIDAEKVTTDPEYTYSSSCKLEPVDASTPTQRKCSMVFEDTDNFQSYDVLSINLTCNSVEKSHILYRPACHIKLDPPPKPFIENTTFTWSPQVIRRKFGEYRCELQWKEVEKSWSDPSVKTIPKSCKWNRKVTFCNCTTDMREPEQLIQGESYEARVRVKSNNDQFYLSTWSDWSETTSWRSSFGRAKPTVPPSGVVRYVFSILGSLAMVALLLVLFKTDKNAWFYMTIKSIRGQIPKPQDSFLKDADPKSWSSPYFTPENMKFFSMEEDIHSVVVSSALDAVISMSPEAALQEKTRGDSSYESTSSSFSNPSYSQLSPPLAPVSLLTAGNLKPCDADTPYGPVGSQGEDGKTEEDKEEESREEIRKFLSKGSNEPMPVVSDYEKVEKPQVERFRLQSLDSGVCSSEEVSQESLEVDSINVSDEDPEGKEEEEETQGEDRKEVDFQKLLEGGFDKGSIQVCSGYEQVQKPQGDVPELNSLDSVISSGDEEEEEEASQEEDDAQPCESTSLLFSPPLHSSALACSLSSFTPPSPLNFSAAALSPDPGGLPIHILGRMALMSSSRPVEPSGDGYMPVRQEQS